MKIGLLAYSTQTGLGIQTQNFFNNMNPHKTLLVDLSPLNHVETHHERFNGGDGEVMIAKGIPDCSYMEWLTDDVDIVFICETPLNYCIMEKAKRKGVPVVLQYNYEFLDYLNRTDIEAPSVLAAPSSWHTEDVKALNIAPVIDLPVPTDASNIKSRQISECRTIFHVAGRQAIHDRNGTKTFVEAALKCGNRFKYKIYAQGIDGETDRIIVNAQKSIDLEVIYNIENYADMYKTGDVLVMPRKYGGLCLPVQEALTAGIPVVMPDVSPNNVLLPKQWLVGARKAGEFMTRTMIDIHETDPNWLAMKMCEFANPEFMAWSNKEAEQIGKALKWETLKPLYTEIFQQIING